MAYQCYRQYGINLPHGSVVNDISAIKIGDGFTLGENCFLFCQDPDAGSSLTIGNRVALNTGVTINADFGGEIDIGDNVIIGPDVVIRAANHIYKEPSVCIRDQGHEPGYIIIEDDVWLGARVIVLPNTKIGKGSIIGAGSVVTRSIPPYSVAVGTPATVIKHR